MSAPFLIHPNPADVYSFFFAQTDEDGEDSDDEATHDPTADGSEVKLLVPFAVVTVIPPIYFAVFFFFSSHLIVWNKTTSIHREESRKKITQKTIHSHVFVRPYFVPPLTR